MKKRSRWVVALAVGCLAAASTPGHDWSELAGPPADGERLELALGVAEEVQEAALREEGIAPMTGDRLAADWLEWLTVAVALDTRAGREALSDRLVAVGFVESAARESAVLAWSHDLEHLALVTDAVGEGVDRAQAEAAARRLETAGLPDAEAVRLGYVAWLGSVAEGEKETLAPLVARLGRLIAAARAGGGS